MILFNQILLALLALLSLILGVNTPDRFMRWVFGVVFVASICALPFLSRIIQ